MARKGSPKTKAKADTVKNNLSTAVGLTSSPFDQFLPAQVTLTDTLEKNLRGNLVSNNYILLSRMYLENIVQGFIDTPVDDAFRGGIHIFTKQLDEDQIEKLSVKIDRENDLAVAKQACKWDRLYGGSGIIIVLSDQDPTTPLDVAKISEKSELKFQACNLWELYFTQGSDGKWNMPPSGEGAPLQETILTSAGYVNPEFYQYYTCKLHASRLLRMIGIEAPSFLRAQLRGWGASMVESIVAPLNQYMKINDLTFELLDECKVDVFKISGLNQEVVSDQGTAQIRKRLTIANMQKNYQHAIALDTEDDFDYKNLSGSFSGIAEVSRENRVNMSAALRMPQNKIWGQSSTAFSSGQDDLENYASLVEGQVREKVKWHIHRIVELRCQQLYGFIPDDLKISFDSLRIMTSEQEETVKNAKFTRLLQARERGEITRYEFREACNREKLLGISLDLAGQDLNEDDAEAETIIEKAEIKEEGAKVTPIHSAALNDLDTEISTLTAGQILEEAQAKKFNNTAGFDRASYAADGGDAWTRGRPKEMFEDYTDPALWAKAKERSIEAYGREKWEFIVWWYVKHGGKFVA